MSFRIMGAAVACVIASSAAAGAQSGSPYETDVCPIPEGIRGYTIVARPEAGTGADSAYLQGIADLAGGHMGDLPRDSLRAAVLATVRRDGGLRRASLADGSGNRRFDRAVLAGVREAFESDHRPAPAGFTADSLVIRLLFGEEPAAGEAYRRFSVQYRFPELRTGRGGQMDWPAELPAPPVTGAAIVWVKFDTAGVASVAETHEIQATDPRLTTSVWQLVPRLQFVPGLSDCEPQGYTEPVRIDFLNRSTVRVQLPAR